MGDLLRQAPLLISTRSPDLRSALLEIKNIYKSWCLSFSTRGPDPFSATPELNLRITTLPNGGSWFVDNGCFTVVNSYLTYGSLLFRVVVVGLWVMDVGLLGGYRYFGSGL